MTQQKAKEVWNWELPEFKGRCMGVRLVPRSLDDPHVCFDLLTEDDDKWLGGIQSPSSFWLPDLQKVLRKAAAWMRKNCVESVYKGETFGYDFTPEWMAAMKLDFEKNEAEEARKKKAARQAQRRYQKFMKESGH